MFRRVLSLAAAIGIVALSGCNVAKLLGTDTTGTSKLTTTQSIWINANWGGGATGLPNGAKAVTPNNLMGSYCPATSVLLYNHTSPISGWATFGGLILKNNCSASVSYLICSTAGGSQSNGIPKCDVDPRTTPLSRLLSLDLPGGAFDYVGNTTIDAGVNVFYCPSGNQFALGIISGAAPTDCWKP